MRYSLQTSLLFSALLLCCTPQARPPGLIVYAAASLSDALPVAAAAYPERDGAKIVFNFAASGTLARQILAAGRDGVFISADAHWLDAVEKSGGLEDDSRTVVLRNRLVLVVRDGTPFLDAGELCRRERFPFTKIAIGDPEYVPAGRHARRWLESIRCSGNDVSLWQRWTEEQRLYPAADVRAALAFARARSRGAAVVYRTDYLSARDELTLLHTVPAGIVDVTYEAAVLRDSPPTARRFLVFLRSPAAQQVFAAAGFGP